MLTSGCRRCFSFLALSEYLSKDPSYQGTCVKDLPAQSHWEIPYSDLKPVGDQIAVHSLEKHSCDKAHNRAHETYGNGRDHHDRELMKGQKENLVVHSTLVKGDKSAEKTLILRGNDIIDVNLQLHKKRASHQTK